MSQKFDPVRPGEQWFCYWKTSAALWEQRIREIPPREIMFIPVFWGLHTDNGQSWDFGQNAAERDLARLVHLLTQHGREYSWLLPLTPAPFLPNGGIPIVAARTLSLSLDGVQLSAFDSEGILNKMHSYYDPKVFQTFGSFVAAFGSFLSLVRSRAKVWGTTFTYLENDREISFLNDHSVAFEQGLSRYLKKAHPEGIELSSPLEELQLRSNFRREVSELFSGCAQDALAPFWGGKKSICVLGSGPTDTLERGILQGRSQSKTFKEILETVVHGGWFSSVLLTSAEKKEITTQYLNEHFGPAELDHQYRLVLDTSITNEKLKPLSLIEIIDNTGDVFDKNGLRTHLDRQFRWMYGVRKELTFTPEEVQASEGKIKFFHGKNMDRTHFGQMMRLFMMGERVVFDQSGLAPELEKRLHVFYLENNLKLQEVNFKTSITISELGEGRFISFHGDRLVTSDDQSKFWNQLFTYLRLQQPEVSMDDDVFALWRIRATSAHELNFLDVRRVNIYNPTSYKKSVMVHTFKKFAFMKMVDPVQANARTVADGVEVELLPNGRVALDFGRYEEK